MSKTNIRSTPSSIRTLRRHASPSPSCDEAPKARGVGRVVDQVTPPSATVSPMRSAKNDRPLITASPESADATTASSVETTRGSKTTMQCAELALLRAEHPGGAHDGIVHRLVGIELAGPAADAEADPGLRLCPLPGDGVDGEERVRALPADEMPVVRRPAPPPPGCRRSRPRRPAARGDRAAASPVRARAPSRPSSSMGVAATPSSHRSSSAGGHAVGHGQDDVGVRGGEAGVVPGIGQCGGDHRRVERAGLGEAHLAALAAGPSTRTRMPTPEESAEDRDSTSPS